MKLRFLTVGLFACALWFAGCGGGPGVINYPTVATPAPSFSPLPAASATMQATLVSSGATTVTLPTVAGVSGTLTLPGISGLAGNATITLTVSTRPVAGVGTPSVPTLLYVSFPLPAGAALTGPPSLNLTLPSGYTGPYSTILIGQYTLGNSSGTITPSARLRPQDTTTPVPLSWLWYLGPQATASPSPTPSLGPTPSPVPTWLLAPISQNVVVGGAAISYTVTTSTPTFYSGGYPNISLYSGQSAQFTLAQSSQWVFSPPISLSSPWSYCQDAEGFLMGNSPSLSASITTTSSGLQTATYSVSESLSARDAIYAQLGSAVCNVVFEDVPHRFELFTTLGDQGPVPTPTPMATPTPAPTPDAIATTSAMLYTGMNDINTINGQIPVPAIGFTKADLSLPGVVTQTATGTLTVAVGRANFAPSVFPSTLPGTPLEFISVAFSQPFSFNAATASGLTSDLCFPSTLITAGSYTFTYYANGVSLGHAAATVATNDSTCTNTHLSAPVTPLGTLPANSTEFGLLISSP